jgi:hypothetical protein
MWGISGRIFGGAENGLSSHVGLLVEAEFDVGSLEVDLGPGTRIDTQVRSLHIIGGVTFHF